MMELQDIFKALIATVLGTAIAEIAAGFIVGFIGVSASTYASLIVVATLAHAGLFTAIIMLVMGEFDLGLDFVIGSFVAIPVYYYLSAFIYGASSLASGIIALTLLAVLEYPIFIAALYAAYAILLDILR